MYNKVWRRVYGKPRHGKSDITNLKVRIELGIPSLDCIVRKRRLKYLVRLSMSDLPPLLALLQTKSPHGRQMPWNRLVLRDLEFLHAALPRVFSELPAPH
eukprot:8280170-Karenia_brevis.AAC.1